MTWLLWALPLALLAVAGLHALRGEPTLATLYVALAAGVGLHALGLHQGVRPLQWFGAGTAAFALAILLWLAFG